MSALTVRQELRPWYRERPPYGNINRTIFKLEYEPQAVAHLGDDNVMSRQSVTQIVARDSVSA